MSQPKAQRQQTQRTIRIWKVPATHTEFIRLNYHHYQYSYFDAATQVPKPVTMTCWLLFLPSQHGRAIIVPIGTNQFNYWKRDITTVCAYQAHCCLALLLSNRTRFNENFSERSCPSLKRITKLSSKFSSNHLLETEGHVKSRGKHMYSGIAHPRQTSPSAIWMFWISVASRVSPSESRHVSIRTSCSSIDLSALLESSESEDSDTKRTFGYQSIRNHASSMYPFFLIFNRNFHSISRIIDIKDNCGPKCCF